MSAWAGVHYFASRDVDETAVLTWPEGNGWIVKSLREKLAAHIRPGSLAFRVTQNEVDYYDVHERVSTAIRAERIIFACPTYLAGLVRNIDIMRWGHAMVRPRPRFIWGESRRRFARAWGRIHFAHSDLSGFSIFEEAQYRGVVAAQWVLGG